jgi:hypothetical protein
MNIGLSLNLWTILYQAGLHYIALGSIAVLLPTVELRQTAQRCYEIHSVLLALRTVATAVIPMCK